MIRLNGVDKQSTLNTPSSTPMGTYHFADNPNLYEVQRTNNFEFIVTGLDSLLKAGTSNVIANAQEILRCSVTQASVPHFSQQPIEIKRGNSSIKAAGVPTFEGGQIIVNDFIGADTKSILMSWQALSYNVHTQKVGLMSDYKKDAYLVEYTPDLQKVRQWKLHGCWVSGLSETEYNMEDNSKKTITATIQYDRAELDVTETL